MKCKTIPNDYMERLLVTWS